MKYLENETNSAAAAVLFATLSSGMENEDSDSTHKIAIRFGV